MAEKFERDSIGNTLTVAIGLSLVCSILVASAAVILKPVQQRNAEEYRQRIILEVAGLMAPGADIAERFAGIESRQVELAGGDTREVYLDLADGTVRQVILPIEGPGLWSTMRGYLAVDADGSTIRGIRFYEHGETPGLGDQIDRDDWRSQWTGKQIYDDGGNPRIEVVKGFVAVDSPNSHHQVDGLSGATLTGNGVTDLVRHWTGPDGFGPYLRNMGGGS